MVCRGPQEYGSDREERRSEGQLAPGGDERRLPGEQPREPRCPRTGMNGRSIKHRITASWVTRGLPPLGPYQRIRESGHEWLRVLSPRTSGDQRGRQAERGVAAATSKAFQDFGPAGCGQSVRRNLIWQHDTTRHVTVWCEGAGWRLVGAADPPWCGRTTRHGRRPVWHWMKGPPSPRMALADVGSGARLDRCCVGAIARTVGRAARLPYTRIRPPHATMTRLHHPRSVRSRPWA
jgi:hypothetical protein